MPAKREIMYPVFLECCEYTPDSFWESVFEDLSYGKCPYGTYISKGFFCCAQKKKEFSYRIEIKDTKLIYDDVYELLTKKLCLLSQKDRNKKKNALIIAANDKTLNQEWGSIRKKSVKDMCVEKFVVEAKSKYCLTLNQARYLLSVIVIALVFKAVTAKDITYTDGKIINIEGIKFKKGEMIIDDELRSLDTKISPVVAEYKKLLSESWDKYLKDLRKPIK
jgi:hypothetical protein